MRIGSNGGRVALVAALLVLVSAVVQVGDLGPSSPADAQTALPYTLEVTPSTGLVDGAAVSVTVRANPGEKIALGGKLNVCRADATYTTANDVVPFVGGNCPDRPVTSSASGIWPVRPYPDGSAAISRFRVGVGRVTWGPATDPEAFSLTCDPANPCRLVIEIPVEGKGTFYDASTVLTFATEDPLSVCGGVADAAVSSGGPDRLLGAWVTLTQRYCASTGAKAPTQAVLAGEGEGQGSFDDGLADLTYSAVGARFPNLAPADARASVSVPMAMNAAVIGVLGGYGSNALDWPAGVPRPYENLQVTMEEMATLFGKGPFTFGPAYEAALKQRNPELAASLTVTNNSNRNPFAPAQADAVAWITSSAFDVHAATQWRTPPLAVTGNPPDVDRGVHESFATADPPFVSALFELYSAQAQLKKLVAANEFLPFNYGPIWILTDLATANALRIPTVALENAAGEFVKPTAQSLLAAVGTLDRQDDGTYLPDVAAAVPGAYPLTFVEHAVAPVEELVDEQCAPRTAAQDELEGWLTYLTGAGQTQLPAGLVPLPAALRTSAAASLAEVGSEPAGCATTPPPGGGPTGPGGGLPGGFGDGAFPGGFDGGDVGDVGDLGGDLGGGFDGSGDGTGAGSFGVGAGEDEIAAGGDGSEEGDDQVEIILPELASSSSSGSWATGAALVVLALLIALGGLISAGWRPGAGERGGR